MPDQLGQGVELFLRRTHFKISSIRAHIKHLNSVNLNGIQYFVGCIVVFTAEHTDPLWRDDASRRGIQTISVVQVIDARQRCKEFIGSRRGNVFIVCVIASWQILWAVLLREPDEPFRRNGISVALNVMRQGWSGNFEGSSFLGTSSLLRSRSL